jgi:hypothetical protein
MKPSVKIAVALAGLATLGTAQANAGMCTKEIASVEKQLSASDAGSGPTKGRPAPTAGDEKGQHPPTSTLGKETRNKATSPEDVLRQTGIKAEASKALQTARNLDKQGKEAACMDAVRKAKDLASR